MAQLTYDELRLLRQLERGDQTISDKQPRGGLNRLVGRQHHTAQPQACPSGRLKNEEYSSRLAFGTAWPERKTVPSGPGATISGGSWEPATAVPGWCRFNSGSKT